MNVRTTYSMPHILLHWVIVVLVTAQFLTADAMGEFFEKAERAGMLAGFPTNFTAIAHALGGGLIFVLTLIRFGIRRANGAPPPPASWTPALRIVSRATHYAFYVLLILLPVTGITALYLNSEAGDADILLKTVLLACIVIHIVGALAHVVFFRDGTIRRMLPLKFLP